MLAARPVPPTVGASFLAGLRATLPLAVSIVPFMTVYGVTARAAGLPAWFAQLLTVVVFAGSQLAAVQLLAAGASGLVAGLTAVLLNVRHVVYSAALAPRLRHLSLPWRLLLGYFLTDETYATLSARLLSEPAESQPQWFLLGGGVIVWVAAQSGTALGVWLGAQIPSKWSLDFAGTLALLALLVLSLRHRAAGLSALVAGSVALVASGLPWRFGLIAALGAGLSAGWLVQRWERRRAPREEGAPCGS